MNSWYGERTIDLRPILTLLYLPTWLFLLKHLFEHSMIRSHHLHQVLVTRVIFCTSTTSFNFVVNFVKHHCFVHDLAIVHDSRLFSRQCLLPVLFPLLPRSFDFQFSIRSLHCETIGVHEDGSEGLGSCSFPGLLSRPFSGSKFFFERYEAADRSLDVIYIVVLTF